MPRPSFINGALKSKGLKLEYSPQNILNHEVTFVLGLVWVLISKFNIDDIGEEGKTAKEALLQWCKRKVNPYGVPVTNFGSSWKKRAGITAPSARSPRQRPTPICRWSP